MVGIVSYGAYIPKFRIKTEAIAKAWNKRGEEVVRSLGLVEKAVPAEDEDAVTLGFEAARQALELSSLDPTDIEVLLVGCESHPYAVNPTSTIVGEFLGLSHNYLAADLEFACKAGTAGMQAIAGLVASGQVKYGMAIGTDTAQSKPHDALEYASAAGSGAFLLGKNQLIAKLLNYTSYSSDTPDFWRRDGIRYPSHAGRFTGIPAYFAHVAGAAKSLIVKTKIAPGKIDHCVFHMPNGKFPREVAKFLGFTPKQLAASLTVEKIGNPYSASSLLGLAAVLDQAREGETIFMVSYGSGAGSDAFLWEATDQISKIKNQRSKLGITVADYIKNKTYVDYVQYLKQTHKI